MFYYFVNRPECKLGCILFTNIYSGFFAMATDFCENSRIVQSSLLNNLPILSDDWVEPWSGLINTWPLQIEVYKLVNYEFSPFLFQLIFICLKSRDDCSIASSFFFKFSMYSGTSLVLSQIFIWTSLVSVKTIIFDIIYVVSRVVECINLYEVGAYYYMEGQVCIYIIVFSL